MKKLSIKLTTLLLVCLTFLLTGALNLTTISNAKADEVHKVVFMLDETTEYESQEIDGGSYASIPETPEMAGKIFLHWEDESGNKFSFKTKIEKDTILTAKWQLERAMYTVKFCVDGQVINEQVVQEGQSVIAPVDFELEEGKEFDCWDASFNNVSQDLVINAILKDKQYTVVLYGFNKEVLSVQQVSHGQDFIMPTIPEVPYYTYEGCSGNAQYIVEDGKLYLNYEPVEFTVSFTVDGKTYERLESVSVKYGETVAFPGVVSRLGHVFMGWFTDLDSDLSFDFSTPITQSIELKAKVAPVIEKFEVKFFDFDNNQYGGTQTIEQGKSAILPGSPYKEGYEFVGWNGNYTEINADTNVYPVFRIKSYTVKFYDGQTLLSEQVVNHGDSAVEPQQTPTKQGFDFVRWDKNFNKVNSDLEIYAVFEEKVFVVMFYNYNMKKIGATQFVKYGQSAVVPILAEREGFDFLGWDGDHTNIVEDVVFVAQYQAKVYTLDFYYGNEKVHSQSVEYGKSIDFYAYELQGYLFYGWYLDAELTMPFSFNTKLENDLSVYAKMQQVVAQTFTVTFKGEDGSLVSVQTIEKGQGATLPAGPYKEGYTFSYWEKVDGEGGYGNVQNNLEYVARYNINTYKVSFVYGTNVYEEQWIQYGQSATAPSVDLVGHTFVGWDKEFNFISGDLTIKAIFEPNEYQVVFKDLESGDVYSTQTVKYGGKVSIPKSPQKEGYLFKKWKMFDGTQTIEFSFDTAIVGETIIVAEFEGRPYTIYYYINGELYDSQKVLFNQIISALDEPDYGDDYEFSGWGEMPEIMPAKNLTITATLLKYYNVIFTIDGQIYHTERVLEGQIIPNPIEPDYDKVKYSFKWDEMPEIMPNEDLTINGEFEQISADKDNEFAFVIEQANGKATIDVYVRGNVKVGGVIIEINIENLNGATANLDENFADYNVVGDKIIFVWAQGYNLTEFTELASFVVDGQINIESIDITISAYAFDGDNVENANSSWTIIQK